MVEIFKFSEVPLEGIYPEAERVQWKDLVGKEIIVYEFTPILGEFGEFFVIKFKFPGNDKWYSTSTGASIVKQKIRHQQKEGKLPSQGKVVKEGRHWNLV